MNTIQEVVETYQQKVMDSYPSIFTKGDVQHLLGEMLLELEKVSRGTIDFDLEEFKEDVLNKIESVIDNYDFEESVSLELSGREIEISFDDNCSSLMDEIRDEVGQVFDHSEFHRLIETPNV